jgi:outer membrane lipoprotein LolB
LPVSGLRHWLQGFATDSAKRPFVAAPQNANNTVVTPDGWRIQYLGWEDGEAPAMPKRIDLQRSTAEAGEVAIRIFIDSRQAAN